MGLKGDITKDYLRRFPDVKSKTLSRKIYKENKEVFTNAEDARSTVRYYRGKIGKSNRRYLPTDEFIKDSDFKSWNKIPEGEKELDWDNPKIIECEKSLIISDIHVPYHDKESLITALEYGYKIGVDCIYINGDFFDYYKLSRWAKDPRLRSFAEELKTGKSILELIANNFGDGVQKYFKVGNHDYRYELYMMLKAPELLDVPEFRLENILGLKRLGYEMVHNKEFSRINGLATIHGHEGGQSFTNPVNPARGAFLKMIDSVMLGHHHQPSTHTSTQPWKDKYITCWSTGCLIDLHPAYMPVNKWAHGFAINHKDGEGFNIENKRIIKGKIMNV